MKYRVQFNEFESALKWNFVVCLPAVCIRGRKKSLSSVATGERCATTPVALHDIIRCVYARLNGITRCARVSAN